MLKGLYRLLNKILIFSIEAKIVPADSFALSKGVIGGLIYFGEFFSLLEKVPGDIVECGVSGGASFATLCILVEREGGGRHIWGFDSFKGLPAPSDEDLSNSKSKARKGLFRASPGTVRNTLRVFGVGEYTKKNHITLVKGAFSQTLPKYNGPQIALLHIDADLYESYKVCLETLWAKVAVGGIVAFHEYGSIKYPGARKAVDEFFSHQAKNVKMRKRFGRYYVIKKA